MVIAICLIAASNDKIPTRFRIITVSKATTIRKTSWMNPFNIIDVGCTYRYITKMKRKEFLPIVYNQNYYVSCTRERDETNHGWSIENPGGFGSEDRSRSATPKRRSIGWDVCHTYPSGRSLGDESRHVFTPSYPCGTGIEGAGRCCMEKV